MKIVQSLDENEKYLNEVFTDCADIVKRRITVGTSEKTDIFVMYADGMSDRDQLENSVLDTFMLEIRKVSGNMNNCIYEALKNNALTTADFKEETDCNTVITEILSGNTLLLIDGYAKAIIISSKGFPGRGVSEADTEVVIQGSKESFTESYRSNTALVRRRIRDPNLKIKQMQIGRRSKTDAGVMYLKDVARDEILDEVLERLGKIDIDAILDSGYIEQLIEDDKYSPFPQMQMTERPDKAASAILEGRIAIIVDNTPFAIILPSVLASFYQSAEDYYERWEIMSFLRVIRYIAGIIAAFLPGLYIAVSSFHPSMIPMELMLKMSEARNLVPVSTVVEVLIMELAFETLREAGIRLPAAIGSTLGIIGGIIIGQAAIDAGIASPLVVIVISLTGIASFAIPNVALVSAYRLVKYLVIFMSAFLGLFGFCAALLLILIHLVTLRSFGIPYMFPFVSLTPDTLSDLKDTVIKPPLTSLYKRPIFAKNSQKIRMKKGGK